MGMLQYGVFKMPKKVVVDVSHEEIDSCTTAVFKWAPFDRGMGHTIGNLLRRILLSGIESIAVVGVRIGGFLHEFMAIEGVVEDMMNIALNVKEMLICFNIDSQLDVELGQREFFVSKRLTVSKSDIADANGTFSVMVKDVFESDCFFAYNDDHVLFHVTKPFQGDVTFRLRVGRGYVPISKLDIKDRKEYEVLLDGVFSPVKSVSYNVESCRVGDEADLDKLVMNIVTDGRVSAKAALSAAIQVFMHHANRLADLVIEPISFLEEEAISSLCEEQALMSAKLVEKIEDMDLGVRAYNCLKESGVEFVVELLLFSESELMCIKNLGRKSLDEIKQRLIERGLFLGMDISKMGITKDNVKEKVLEMKQSIINK